MSSAPQRSLSSAQSRQHWDSHALWFLWCFQPSSACATEWQLAENTHAACSATCNLVHLTQSMTVPSLKGQQHRSAAGDSTLNVSLHILSLIQPGVLPSTKILRWLYWSCPVLNGCRELVVLWKTLPSSWTWIKRRTLVSIYRQVEVKQALASSWKKSWRWTLCMSAPLSSTAAHPVSGFFLIQGTRSSLHCSLSMPRVGCSIRIEI